ncbi:hypothetical protein C7G41_06080 [Bradyrhizobium sp. MOS002]|nr:hypothetical protein C7G41_06080 [Bradyrhizobium sp. MOS002]
MLDNRRMAMVEDDAARSYQPLFVLYQSAVGHGHPDQLQCPVIDRRQRAGVSDGFAIRRQRRRIRYRCGHAGRRRHHH